MNITETTADGLKREFQIVIPANDIEEKVNLRLEELRRTIQLPGFRPGKVPEKLVRQRYHGNALAEVLEAQKTILGIARQLAKDGTIRLAGSGDDDYV